jgi:glutathione S-transferase
MVGRRGFPFVIGAPKLTQRAKFRPPRGFEMITLYGVYRSRASRPLWLLAEIGLPFTHVPVIQGYRLPSPTAAGAVLNTTSPAFLAINPQGQIPAYVEGDLVLSESLAITLHIARRHGGVLGPQSDAESAMMEQWALFAATSIETPALEILYTQGDGGDKTAEGQAAIAINAEKLRRPLARLQAHLATQDWLVAGWFTVADLNAAECLRYAQGHPTLLAEFPSVKAWLERCQARPAFQAMWAARLAEPA